MQGPSRLTQADADYIVDYCGGRLEQADVELLYARFVKLDRGKKGFLSRDEFLAIPEISINPLSTRLVRLFSGVNFVEFANLLSYFHPRTSRQDKVRRDSSSFRCFPPAPRVVTGCGCERRRWGGFSPSPPMRLIRI